MLESAHKFSTVVFFFARIATPLGTYMRYTSMHAHSAFHYLTVHDTRIRAANVPATRGKMYVIVLVCTQKCAGGGGNRGYRIPVQNQ